MKKLNDHVYYQGLNELSYFTGKNHTTKINWTMDNKNLYGDIISFINLDSNQFKISYLHDVIDDLKSSLISCSVSQDDKIFFRFENIIFSYGKLYFNLDKFVDHKVNQLLKFGFPDTKSIFNNSWLDTILDYQFPIIDPKLITWEEKYSKLVFTLHKNFKSGTHQGMTYELEDTYFSNINHTLSDYKLIDNVITKDFDVFIMCPIKNQDTYDQNQINIIKSELRKKFISFKVIYL